MEEFMPKRKGKPRAVTTATHEVPAGDLKQNAQRFLKVSYVTEECNISYADLYTVQHYPKEFIVSFFQTDHPLLFEKGDLERLSGVTATCIHRIALRPDQMLEFA